jgi:predicted nuclease of restriction endonuclease-like (RecB) superfamily
MCAFAGAWPDLEIVQAPLGQLRWYHHLEKLRSREERLWYLQIALGHGWSPNVLVHQIESRLMERQGAAITSFVATLPPPQSDMAQQLTKDPYIFDTLGLGARYREREIEDALISQMQRFLLELGRGFAFMGRQFPLEVRCSTARR